MIEFKEGAVCYAGGRCWKDWNCKLGQLISFDNTSVETDSLLVSNKDFQLNEPREGYYIPKSELDTEEKYNQAVDVFGLFGFEWKPYVSREFKGPAGLNLLITKLGIVQSCEDHNELRVKLTFDQLMAIGELKRKMNERDLSLKITKAASDFGVSDTELAAFKEKPKRRNKSKQAYDILKDLDYEYDLVKQQWYKKQYI